MSAFAVVYVGAEVCIGMLVWRKAPNLTYYESLHRSPSVDGSSHSWNNFEVVVPMLVMSAVASSEVG